MLIYKEKVFEYLKTNKVVNDFIHEVDQKISEHHTKNLSNLSPPHIEVELGNKFIKIIVNRSCWGFISRVDGKLKGYLIRKGDLLKPASWHAPAKHARGNIIDGTAKWDIYGPEYFK